MKKRVMRSTALKTMGPSEMTAIRRSELMLGFANDCESEERGQLEQRRQNEKRSQLALTKR